MYRGDHWQLTMVVPIKFTLVLLQDAKIHCVNRQLSFKQFMNVLIFVIDVANRKTDLQGGSSYFLKTSLTYQNNESVVG